MSEFNPTCSENSFEFAGITVVQFHGPRHEFRYDGLTKPVGRVCCADGGDITHGFNYKAKTTNLF